MPRRKSRRRRPRCANCRRYDPATGKWDLINTCFTTHHLYFAHDANETLWMSAGGPGLGGGIVGWLNTKQFRETKDGVASQGWTPLVIDTNGNGKRDAFVGAKDPVDPAKDKRIMASFYGIMPSPVDDFDLGAGDGPRLLARRSARLPHPRDAGL